MLIPILQYQGGDVNGSGSYGGHKVSTVGIQPNFQSENLFKTFQKGPKQVKGDKKNPDG